MLRIAEQFVCNLKEDFYHTIQDQTIYWSFRGYLHLADIHLQFGYFESLFFNHGWLILLIWRLFNVALDTHKRLRDYNKPEWESGVVPILRQEAKDLKKMSLWGKIWFNLKNLFK